MAEKVGEDEGCVNVSMFNILNVSVSVSMHRLAVLFTCLLLFICVYFIQTFLFVRFVCSSAMFVARAFVLLLSFVLNWSRFLLHFVARPTTNEKKTSTKQNK